MPDVPNDHEVCTSSERDGSLDGMVGPGGGLAAAQGVAGISKGLLDARPAAYRSAGAVARISRLVLSRAMARWCRGPGSPAQ